MSLRSPNKPSGPGFMPLSNQTSYPEMADNGIPLTTVASNTSSGGARKMGATMNEKTMTSDSQKKPGFFGRRGLRKTQSKLSRMGTDSEEESLTTMGKIYNKIVSFSIVTRYLVYVLPVAAILAVPIVITATGDRRDKAAIGGIKMMYFWIWVEIVWLSIWVAKLFAQAIPRIFMFLCGVVSSGTRKYATVIKNLEVPLSLIGWAAISFATFQVLSNIPDNPGPIGPNNWTKVMKKLLTAALIGSGIFLGEKLIIQLISMNYHKRSFDNRIKDSKHMVYLIGLLYDASRTLFPMYCHEFEEEDLIINDSVEARLGIVAHHSRSGSVTPMRLIGNIGRFGDKVTSAFGNIASEIAGKEVFNPSSAHSIVVEALEKKRSSEALAKRLWMSFVVEGKDSLMIEDLREVLGPARQDEADEIFSAIDGDGNGDISLDEMIMKIVEIGRDRVSIANSMKDIGEAIRVLDQVLAIIAFIIIVFVFVAFLNTGFVTFLATASTTLLSLSFVFAVTAQEFLGSCIFLFVKHPYDVGDRVDIAGPDKMNLVVEQISLLYTVFKRIDCMKMVQVPNIVLNSMWVDNVSRSRAMKEQLDVFISFDTSIEDLELLRAEMEAFVRHGDNNRDFQPDIVLECTGLGNMDKLQLKVEIRHKSNWSNETVRAARRSKFMCALVLALRKVPIYPPGGGNTPLGDPGNPTYSVAVSDEIAQEGRDKAAKNKEAKRMIPTKTKPSSKDSGKDKSESSAADALNARKPADDAGRDETGRSDNANNPNTGSRDNSLERQRTDEVEDLRAGLLTRVNTRGRRRKGDTLPPQALSPGRPGFSVTAASPRRSDGFDEEARMEYTGGRAQGWNPTLPPGGPGSRVNDRYFPSGGPPGVQLGARSGSGSLDRTFSLGSQQQALGEQVHQPPSARMPYTMFPSQGRAQTTGPGVGVGTQRLQPLGSSPPDVGPAASGNVGAGRARGMSLGQKNVNSMR